MDLKKNQYVVNELKFAIVFICIRDMIVKKRVRAVCLSKINAYDHYLKTTRYLSSARILIPKLTMRSTLNTQSLINSYSYLRCDRINEYRVWPVLGACSEPSLRNYCLIRQHSRRTTLNRRHLPSGHICVLTRVYVSIKARK